MLGMYFWLGSEPYGARYGKYYGFNFFDVFSVHYAPKIHQISVQVGNYLRFYER